MINGYLRVICGAGDMSKGPQLLLFPVIVLMIFYVMGAGRLQKRWPFSRLFCFISGVCCVSVTLIEPLSVLAHIDFRAHMIAHLLLGMLAPLLFVLSAPMTLFLKVIPVSLARFLCNILKTYPFSFIVHPLVATILNIGGLWLLYGTELYNFTHTYTWVDLLVHFHILLAGYVFTLSMIPVDPLPKRISFLFRAIVLILALTAHGVLAKYIYIHPPYDVAKHQAEIGAVIMYYGGDVIDIVIMCILCKRWFRTRRFQKREMEVGYG